MQVVFWILAIISVVVFFIGMLKPALFINKKTGEVPDRKDLAAGTIFLFLFSLVMLQFIINDTSSPQLPDGTTTLDTPVTAESPITFDTQVTTDDPITIEPPVEVAPLHHYALKEGYEYGYEPALTEEDKSKGRLASDLLMFKYAGTKGETVQLYQKSGTITVIIECNIPCDFIKLRTYSEGLGYMRTERLRRTDGMIASWAVSDAIDGFLEQSVVDRDGQQFNVWWDEHGPQYTAVDL